MTKPWLERNALPILAFAAGVVFTLHLASFVREGAFYSGDGSLKFALARQLAAGGWHADLRLPADPVVRGLWDAGMYPLLPPFVHATRGGVFVAFPLFFPAITAPLYSLFGTPGLYVVPLAAAWAAMFLVGWFVRRQGVGPLGQAVAIAGLAFATPLSIYAATYWEHTLAAALAAGGLFVAFSGSRRPGVSGAVGGALIGLAGWFRPEALAMGAVAVVVRLVAARAGSRRGAFAFVAAAAIAVTLFLAFNQAVYGRPLGMHGAQVLDASLADRASTVLASLTDLNLRLLAFAPVAVAVIAWLLAGGRVPPPTGPLRSMLWIVAGTCALVPFVVPNTGGKEWGPRYLLIVVPLIAAASGALVHALGGASRAARAGGAGLLAAALCVGGWQNAVLGRAHLAADYATRVAPAYDVARADPRGTVVFGHPLVALELVALAGDKSLVLVRSRADLARAGEALGDRGGFLFVTVGDAADPKWASAQLDDGRTLACAPVGRLTATWFATSCQIVPAPGIEPP